MLGIKGDGNQWKQWHVGERLPKVSGRVVTFQADGHELTFLMEALALRQNFNPYYLVNVEQSKNGFYMESSESRAPVGTLRGDSFLGNMGMRGVR
jgi:hypothetical protein